MKKKIKKTSKRASKKTGSSAREETSKADDFEMSDEPKKGRPTMVNYDEFVKVWRDASSVSDVASAMGIKRNSASAIAARLRAAGVTNLRSFPRRGAQPIDVKRLNKLAAGKSAD